ncbi:trypsin-like serine protease [Kitasatospora sp. NPDC088346]|uniref:trypsin-like serine protease n=1 Tax=Kitasatospora sp. NPDC088346 TaxID=3364073 RepID=UPI00381BB66F
MGALPDKVCFKVTGASGYLALEISDVIDIKGDDHTIKATLSAAGAKSSVDIAKNAWTPVGQADVPGGSKQSALVELVASDGAAPSVPASEFPAVGSVAVGAAGRADSRGCTGTLVDPRWVLTSAGCFTDNPGTLTAGAPAVKSTFTVGGRTVDIAELALRTGRDAVLARLASPVDGITPVKLATAAPVAGESLRVPGYGRTGTDWVPTKAHTTTHTIGAITATGIDSAPAAGAAPICAGDTGAPLLREKNGTVEIAGIAFRSWQGGCLDTPSAETRTGAYNTRVDDLRDWVQQTRALSPGWKTETLVRSDNSLYQAVRLSDGSWTSFGNVETKAGGIGGVKSAAAAGIDGDTHVVAIGGDGHVRHTVRTANGTWGAFGDINGEAGWLGSATQVSAVSIGADLHVLVVANGKLFHTLRNANGSWTGFGDVSGAAGPIGTVTGVAAASVGGQLQVAAVNGGKVFHTIRAASGSWSGWGDVAGAAGATGPVSSVAMAGVGADAHIVVATDSGTHQYHAIRKGDGNWEGFGDLNGVLGQVTISSVGATAVDGAFQLAAVTADNKVLHTVRHTDRTWSAADVVDLQGVNGTRNGVAITGTL